MDIELLATFLEVNKTRHFGKAAENLYLTQAAVSARVRQLEESLKARLFIRARNNIQLTPEGERLIPYARTMLEAWSAARQEVVLKQEHRSQLSIGTTSGLWLFLIQDNLTLLQQRHPELMLRVEAHDRDNLIHLLQEGLLDVVLMFDAAPDARLACHKLARVKLVLLGSESDWSMTQAMQHYVYVDWGVAFNLFHRRKVGDPTCAQLQTNVAEVALNCLAAGPAAAYLPESVLAVEKGRGLSRVVGAPDFTRDVTLLYRLNSPKGEDIHKLFSLMGSAISVEAFGSAGVGVNPTGDDGETQDAFAVSTLSDPDR